MIILMLREKNPCKLPTGYVVELPTIQSLLFGNLQKYR